MMTEVLLTVNEIDALMEAVRMAIDNIDAKAQLYQTDAAMSLLIKERVRFELLYQKLERHL